VTARGDHPEGRHGERADGSLRGPFKLDRFQPG
jgi:hypothetical protein